MIHEPDGVADEVEQLLQRGGQAATVLARARTLKRAQELRDAARDSEQRAREAQARFEAERQAARAQLAAIEREQWWEHSSAREIVETWQTAQEWREHDPVADRAATHMRAELAERLGVDPVKVGDEPLTEADPTDSSSFAGHDLTPEEVRSWEAEVEGPEVIGERGREVQEALLELCESRRIGTAAEQVSVAEAIREGGPRRAPRARRNRGRPGLGAERERGR